MRGEGEKTHDRLKKRLKATRRDKLRGSLPIPSTSPFSHFSLPLFPPFSFLCRFNPRLLVDSSFCILIPSQRGTDNLGRGFFKLAPLTRYAARWVSYRNNFRAPSSPLSPSSPNHRARARETFFFSTRYHFFFNLTRPLLQRSVQWKLRCRLIKRFSTHRLIAISVSNIWIKETLIMIFY